MIVYSHVMDHQKKCYKRPIKCDSESCPWQGNKYDYKSHLLTSHRVLVIPCSWQTLRHSSHYSGTCQIPTRCSLEDPFLLNGCCYDDFVVLRFQFFENTEMILLVNFRNRTTECEDDIVATVSPLYNTLQRIDGDWKNDGIQEDLMYSSIVIEEFQETDYICMKLKPMQKRKVSSFYSCILVKVGLCWTLFKFFFARVT